MSQNNKVTSLPLSWVSNSNQIWLLTTLSLIRNVEKFVFPAKLGSEKKKQLMALLGDTLLRSGNLEQPFLLKADDCSPIEKEFLTEHFLTIPSLLNARGGEGFVCNGKGNFIALLNLQDHILLHTIELGEQLEGGWTKLQRLENDIILSAPLFFSPRYGYLTADPKSCGTGLKIQALLQVPALIHTKKLPEILSQLQEELIEVKGFLDPGIDGIGDTILLSNRFTLGISEENILLAIRSFATKLVNEEKEARKKIKENGSDDIRDKVSRAFGLLAHSYQLEAAEAINALSLVKLGADLGWIHGIDFSTINELMIGVQRGHLTTKMSNPTSSEQLPHKRAEFLHKAITSMKLDE